MNFAIITHSVENSNYISNNVISCWFPNPSCTCIHLSFVSVFLRVTHLHTVSERERVSLTQTLILRNTITPVGFHSYIGSGLSSITPTKVKFPFFHHTHSQLCVFLLPFVSILHDSTFMYVLKIMLLSVIILSFNYCFGLINFVSLLCSFLFSEESCDSSC